MVAGSSLFALIDDIATLLDDVALMSKVAAKKTAGVLGDDLALNAQQVTGVAAERELPVVWAVAKGSFVNKIILVPSSLLISFVAPWAITPLLIAGGLFLCFEGVEKLAHKFLDAGNSHSGHVSAALDPSVDLVEHEKTKIKGAIRTDFILSAEIVVITLGSVAQTSMPVRIFTLVAVALLMTIGVYGLVAGIVKLDDWGKRWLGSRGVIRKKIGAGLLILAPLLMKGLSIAGTAAMFLVGGGILVHGISALHHAIDPLGRMAFLAEMLVGALGGAIVLAGTRLVKGLKSGK